MKHFLSLFTLKLPIYLVYMLQQVEYNPEKFMQWHGRLYDENQPISSTMRRKTLVWTTRAKVLVFVLYASLALGCVPGLGAVLSAGNVFLSAAGVLFGLCLLPGAVVIDAYLLTLVGHSFIVNPKNIKLVNKSEDIFKNHRATKVAVVGSYGKTTMKELLETVLSEGLQVAATPGNKNVPVSHARFAQKLTGEEEVLIVEFGEGEPGDVARMTKTVAPDWVVVTGLAPNHLDEYPSIDALATDILSVKDHIASEKAFVNASSELLAEYRGEYGVPYDEHGVDGWKVHDVAVTVSGVSFSLKRAGQTLQLKSGLLGRHQIGPLACVAILALELGLSIQQVEAGVAKTAPYEHRMLARNVAGAWLIDDTYNGNLEGLIAGLDLLKELEAARKWYVTPGLVDQGVETERVHTQLGEHIARTQPDVVVLMDNSVRPFIEAALTQNGFRGELRVESDPLKFYTGIEHMIAVGDMVLMQNDWTDNYN